MRPIPQLLKAAALAGIMMLARPSVASGLFTQPDRIDTSPAATVITRSVPLGQKQQDTFAFIAQPDAFEVTIREGAVLRNVETGQLRPASLFLHQARLQQFLREVVTARHLGWLREAPIGVARVRVDRRYTEVGVSWELAEYQLEVRTSESEAPHSLPAREGPVLKRLLESMLTDPRQVEVAGRQRPPEQYPGPTEWQPDPAKSPGIPWLLVPIASDGIYTIDREWIEQVGLDPRTTKPGDLSVYLDGRPIGVHIAGPSDGTFASGAKLLFHGIGSDSPETAERIHYVGAPAESSPHWKLLEGNEAPGEGTLKLIHEAEVDTMLEVAMGSFLSIRRMAWVWAGIEADTETEVLFDLPNWAEDQPGTATLGLALFSTLPPNNRTVEVIAQLNDGESLSVRWDHLGADPSVTIPAGTVRRLGNRLRLRLADDRAPRDDGGLFLDRISVTGPARILDPILNRPTRLGAESLGTHPVGGVRPNDLMVYSRRQEGLLPITRQRGLASFQWSGDSGGEIHLIDRTRLQRAPEGRISQWTPLPDNLGRCDYLIITHPDFSGAAERLAAHHRQSGRSVSVYTSVQLYEWFGHGSLSAESIRNFIAWAARQSDGPGPETVLLIGDANADGGNVSRQNIPNYLPMRQVPSNFGRNGDQISSDSFYSWLNPGDELADIIVGRLSVTSAEEALDVVEKIIRFASESGRQRTGLMAVADTGADFTRDLDELTDRFNGRALKLYADQFPWEDNYYLPAHLLNRVEDAKVSPQFTAAIEEAFNRGSILTIFFGHGAPNLWGEQRFWFGGGTPNSDILRLQNQTGLPFVASFTCNNAVIDYPLRPWNVCIAEDFMRHRDRGAIATFMPSGPGFLQHHRTLAEAFLRSWKVAGVTEVGLMAELVRISHQAQNRADDHSRMFVLLGDPLTQIAPWMEPAVAPLPAPPGSVTIQSTHREGDAHRWHLRLSNSSTQNASVLVTAEWFDDQWRSVHRLHQDIQISGQSDSFLALEPTTDLAPGSYQLVARIDDGSGRTRSASLPSSEWRTVFHHGPKTGGPVFPARPRFRPGTRLRGSPQLEVDVINPSIELLGMTVELWKGESLVDQKRVDQLQSGTSTSLLLDLPPDLTPSVDSLLRLRAVDRGGVLLQELRVPLSHEQLPDLAIDQTSVRISPERPSDGLTIFVDLVVSNIGSTISGSAPIGLYAADDEAFENPLRDMTRRNQQTIPPLLPGEQFPVRLRWDPHSNAGPQKIVAMLDPHRLQLEARRNNNSVTRELNVRTKWQLRPGLLRLSDPQDDGSVLLTAEVGNSGETEAQRVTVTFFSSQTQSEQTRLAEMTIDRIDASTTTTVSHRWSVLEKPPLAEDRTPPSFTVSLKGSQQRISSVGGGSR